MENLRKRLRSMADMKPVWIDVTFGAGGSTRDRTLEICEYASRLVGVNVMMHLTCTNMQKEDIHATLSRMKELGIRNVLALRGDPPGNSTEWTACDSGFSHAIDLVKYIRANFGDYFCVGIAGYPEGHADCVSFEKDMEYLKLKVEAGADLIITQLFYDTGAYLRFVVKARTMGISVPIVPGIMPLLSHQSFLKMTSLCKVRVPEKILLALDLIKEDEAAVKGFGVEFAIQMCGELIARGAPGIHLYTMNNEDNIRKIVRGIAAKLPSHHTNWICD